MEKRSIGDLSGLGLLELGNDFFHVNVHGGAIVAFEDTITKKGQPARVQFDRRKTDGFVPWGDDNLFPETVSDLVKKSTILAPRLYQKVSRIYSGGLIWGKLEFGDNNEEKFAHQMHTDEGKQIRAFLRKNGYQRLLWQAIANPVYFHQGWVELILNNPLTQIDRVMVHDARYCRHGWQNSQGIIDQTFVYGDWKKDPKGKGARPVFTVDPTYDIVEQIKASKKQNIMIPLAAPDVLSDYYALAPWDSARQSKWLDISSEIPTLKAAIMKNQISPKYRIRISRAYWELKYPTWTSMKNEERKATWTAFQEEIKKALSGSDNAGKSVISINHYQPGTNKEVEGVMIEPLGFEFKDGQYIEDSNEASTHILTALGEDPTLSGNGPGKNFGAGSGSDKKVAWDIAYSLERPLQDFALEWLNVVRDFNGWDEELIFRFRYGMNANLYSGSGVPVKQSNPTV